MAQRLNLENADASECDLKKRFYQLTSPAGFYGDTFTLASHIIRQNA